jgi:hypothetical protein
MIHFTAGTWFLSMIMLLIIAELAWRYFEPRIPENTHGQYDDRE